MGLNLHTYTYTHKIQAQILPYQTDQQLLQTLLKKYIYITPNLTRSVSQGDNLLLLLLL